MCRAITGSLSCEGLLGVRVHTFQKRQKMDFSPGWKVVIDILQILLRIDLTILSNSSNSSYWCF